MMILKELRGKKANMHRWEALKMLDWYNDQKEIKAIFEVGNPLFFSSRTPNEIIKTIREEVADERF